MNDRSRLLTNAIAGLSGTTQPSPSEPLSPEDAMALAAFLISELTPPRESRIDIGGLKKDPRAER